MIPISRFAALIVSNSSINPPDNVSKFPMHPNPKRLIVFQPLINLISIKEVSFSVLIIRFGENNAAPAAMEKRGYFKIYYFF